MRKVTIQMIADCAGISRGTVDRVLHNRPSVKAEIREQVWEVAAKLGYATDHRETVSKRIGILLPGSGWFDENLKQEWLRGVQDARRIVEPLGLQVEVVECTTDLPNEVVERVQKMKTEALSGVALSAQNSPVIQKLIRSLTEDGIKVVTYSSDIPDSGRICFVGQDVYRSGRVAADLISKFVSGSDEILLVAGNLEIDGHKQRVKGFCDKCKASGISPDRITIIESFNEYLLTYEKVSEVLARKPALKAIYMANESVAACAEAVSQSGRQDKLMVVGNDLTEVTKRLLKEGSVDFIIEQNVYWQGYQPIILLKDLLTLPESRIEPMIFTDISVINSENMRG